MKKSVIELIRVSTKEQAADDCASIPAQRATNRRTALTFGLEIVQTVELVDVSGASILKTPEMQQLLRSIESPTICGVVAREFSRVMRPDNFADYVLFQAFQETGTVLYLPDGPLDLNTKSGKLLGAIRAVMAGNELSEMRERTFAAKEEKRRAGECPQAQICLPFGIGYEKGKGYFYKPEAEQVREAFRRFLCGETSYTALGKILGVTPQGMCAIFKNPIWTGWRVYDKKRNMASSARGVSADGRQGDRPKIMREPDEVIRVKVINDPLLSDAEFARVQALVETKKLFHWKYRADTKHNFTYNGFLLCSECQSTVYGKNASGLYYICRARFWKVRGECRTSYMRRDRLEAKLDGILGEQLLDPSFINRILGALETCSDAATIRGRVARLENEIRKLREKRVRILDSYFEGLVSRAERDTRLGDLEAALRLAEVTLMREVPVVAPSARDLMTAFTPLFDWPVLNRENKRRILAVTVPEIHVSNYAVKGIAVAVPTPGLKRGDMVSRTPAGFDVATNPSRLFLPLNL